MQAKEIILLPVKLPEHDKPVKAIVKHFESWKFKGVELICVDESDNNWRFVDGGSELSYNWDVIYWEYI